MFNFGFMELVVIFSLALIFIGPKQLPEVARALARLINEFKRTTSDLKSTLTETQKQAQSFVDQSKTDLMNKVNAMVDDQINDPYDEGIHDDPPEDGHSEPQHQVAHQSPQNPGSGLDQPAKAADTAEVKTKNEGGHD